MSHFLLSSDVTSPWRIDSLQVHSHDSDLGESSVRSVIVNANELHNTLFIGRRGNAEILLPHVRCIENFGCKVGIDAGGEKFQLYHTSQSRLFLLIQRGLGDLAVGAKKPEKSYHITK